MLRLISVPRSGTRYVRELLAELGWMDRGLVDPMDPEFAPSRWYTSHHTDDLGYPLEYVSKDEVVVPLRDPVLCEISRLNTGWGANYRMWAKVADWRNLENVCFVPVPPSQADVDRLARFVGSESVEVDVTPVGASFDGRGLKDVYPETVPDELRDCFEWLRGRTDVQALFRRYGFECGWMR